MNENSKKRRFGSRSGFTMIEIILVVIIIGILATTVGPKLVGRTEQAKISKAYSTINTVGMALAEYEMVNGTYPTTLDGLLDESKGGPFLQSNFVPKDPWDQPFTYVAPGSNNKHTFDLSCTSSKGVTINNWEQK